MFALNYLPTCYIARQTNGIVNTQHIIRLGCAKLGCAFEMFVSLEMQICMHQVFTINNVLTTK